MKLKTSRSLQHVSLILRFSQRCCSGRPIHIVKSKLIADQTNVISKPGKNEFTVLRQLGFTFTESNADDVSTTNDSGVGSDIQYRVGHFPNQYPSIAHQNISQFRKHLNPLSPRDHWLVTKDAKQCHEDVTITSTVEYEPFPLTYPSTKKSKSGEDTKSSSTKSPKWKPLSNDDAVKMGYCFEDAINENVPILTRKLSKKQSTQTLVLYRDLHLQMSNLQKIEILIDRFKPNKIILELSPDGGSIGLKSLLWWRYKYLISPFLKFRSKSIRESSDSKVGTRWMKVIRQALCVLPYSYAAIKAMEMAIDRNIAICFGDYPERSSVQMIAFGEALDIYHSAFFKKIKFPINKVEGLLTGDGALPRDVARLIAVRMQPHLYAVAGYRNDLMSLAINESIEDRVLFIGGEGHCYDIIDRLTNRVQITNPFKDINEKTVLLKDLAPDYYSGDSKVDGASLNKDDIEKARELIGDEVLLMTVPNREYQSEEKLEQAKTEFFQEKFK